MRRERGAAYIVADIDASANSTLCENTSVGRDRNATGNVLNVTCCSENTPPIDDFEVIDWTAEERTPLDVDISNMNFKNSLGLEHTTKSRSGSPRLTGTAVTFLTPSSGMCGAHSGSSALS